jgi:hypothetical protein
MLIFDLRALREFVVNLLISETDSNLCLQKPVNIYSCNYILQNPVIKSLSE